MLVSPDPVAFSSGRTRVLMANDKVDKAKQTIADMMGGAANMSAERPLDALLPELRRPAPVRVPVTPIHQRVMEVELDTGREWLLTCWADPGSQREFHKQVLALLEAALLVELSRSPRQVREEPVRRFVGIRLIVYPELPYPVPPAVGAFGMREEAYDEESYTERMAALRAEAKALNIDIPDEPAGVFAAPIAPLDGTLGEKLESIHTMMAERFGDDYWGATPGGPSKLFAEYAKREFQETIAPDLNGLRTFELLLVRNTPDVIRWIPPLLFQALCDFIGVVAQAGFGQNVAWADCGEDDLGMCPPALFKVAPKGGKPYHLPIAHHVLRWCMMPVGEGEQVPSLAEWARDQFV